MTKKRNGGGKRPPGNGSYEVGYGKPPAKNRFKKGVSGNPIGRKRVVFDHDPLAGIRDALVGQVTARIGEKKVRMSRFEALFRKQMEQAFNGDGRSVMHMTKMCKELGFLEPRKTKPIDLSILTDEELRWLSIISKKVNGGTDKETSED